MGEDGQTYVQVPTGLFGKLEEILNVAGDNYTPVIGRIWGALVAQEAERTDDIETYKQFATQLSWQVGLNQVEFLEANEERIVIRVTNPEVESREIIGGVLSGMTSEMLGSNYNFSYSDDNTILLTKKEEEDRAAPSPRGKERDEEIDKVLQTPFECGESYLIADDGKGSRSFRVLKGQMDKGVKALCITTIFPPKIADKYGIGEASLIWLTDVGSGKEGIKEVSPERLDFEVNRTINDFIRDNPNSTIMLHGLEYLITHAGYDKVLKFIQQLKNKIAINDMVLLCPIDPGALDNREYANLKLNFTMIGGRS